MAFWKDIFNKESLKTVLSIIFLLWIIYFLSIILPVNDYGIIPRRILSLPGIIFSPFLHGGIFHLLSNSISLLFLGTILLSYEKRRALPVIILLIIFSGAGTWIIGRNAVHIGASGVIYGMLGYLITLGFYKRDFKTIFISIGVFILQGGAILGILPGTGPVSWESHLCGFIAGIFIARFNATPSG